MSISTVGPSFYTHEQDQEKKRAEALKQKLIADFNPKKLGNEGCNVECNRRNKRRRRRL